MTPVKKVMADSFLLAHEGVRQSQKGWIPGQSPE
jgi:hypothetical protein